MLPDIPREQQYLILGLIVAIVLGGGVMAYNRFFAQPSLEPIIEGAGSTQKGLEPVRSLEIEVHLSGAVKKSGVYKLRKEDRLYDLLKAGGGITKNADLDSVNLAEPLNDGQKIVIPEKSQPVRPGNVYSSSIKEANSATFQTKLVNLNTADLKTLDNLPGIGPSTAQKIIDYRTSNGSFKNIEELKEVPGIGPGKFERLKKFIAVY